MGKNKDGAKRTKGNTKVRFNSLNFLLLEAEKTEQNSLLFPFILQI